VPPVSDRDLAVDRELASIADSYQFLVDVSPVNIDQAQEEFLDEPSMTPAFRYRPLEDVPEVTVARLGMIDLSSVEDPSLALLFGAKKRELELQLSMLGARNTDRFIGLSVQLFGGVPHDLESSAEEILQRVPPSRGRRGRRLGAEAVARRAGAAIDGYREVLPDLAVAIEVRSDIAGVMVSNGDLLIPAGTSVPAGRMSALLAHEVDTHVLTYVNGSRQPLRLMAAGLAGYDETQEGLALIAEALVGGLTVSRLRTIAARVVAVRRMLSGWPLPETHRHLVERYGYDRASAFTTVVRVYRAGGFTKDALYLRGLQQMVEYVAAGNDLARLWVGKLSLADLPLVEELRERSVLIGALLLPTFLRDPRLAERLHAIAHNDGLHTLIGAHT
jgi:uncharacterized protein (TIGR02421 family)